MSPSTRRGLFALALSFGVLPLWATELLPFVDLPQHLHLISVLHRISDPTTLYPEVFALRGQLTPYLGYYYAVSLLHWVVPLGVANKLFLTAYVAGLPLSLAFLLSGLRRPTWPALLCVPFAYGDSLAWGFINYCSALPLTFLTCGLFVRAVTDAPRRWRWAGGLAASLVAVLLFHVQAFAYLGVALPLLLALTRAPEDAARPPLAVKLKARVAALAGVAPGVALFVVWVGIRLGEPAQVEYGAPWKAWGPLLSAENLSYKGFEQNWAELVPVLANMLRDGTDRYALFAVAAVGLAGLVAALAGAKETFARCRAVHAAFALALLFSGGRALLGLSRQQPSWQMWLLLALGTVAAWREAFDARSEEGPAERYRMLALAALALVLFLALPFDIRGYMYYLNTRFAHLAAPLVLCCLPRAPERARVPLAWAAAACAALAGVCLARGFTAFGVEARGLAQISAAAAPKARVMGLIFDPGSQVVGHPVYLHAATVVAREAGGLTNFSFALTPHSPLKYRGAPPPTFPSEWRPDQFNYEAMGRAYDHFLLRGVEPPRVFGSLLQGELETVGRAGSFWLVRRR